MWNRRITKQLYDFNTSVLKVPSVCSSGCVPDIIPEAGTDLAAGCCWPPMPCASCYRRSDDMVTNTKQDSDEKFDNNHKIVAKPSQTIVVFFFWVRRSNSSALCLAALPASASEVPSSLLVTNRFMSVVLCPRHRAMTPRPLRLRDGAGLRAVRA
jgi:hypothetical protein